MTTHQIELARHALAGDELVAVCLAFRSGLLDGRPSYGMCGVVCFPLQGFLQCHGLPTILMASTPVIGDWRGHLWLALKDGTALDPTADQYAGRPAVYLGNPDLEIHCNARAFIVGEAWSLKGMLAGKRKKRRAAKLTRAGAERALLPGDVLDEEDWPTARTEGNT
jgi:hypothetical protein